MWFIYYGELCAIIVFSCVPIFFLVELIMFFCQSNYQSFIRTLFVTIFAQLSAEAKENRPIGWIFFSIRNFSSLDKY